MVDSRIAFLIRKPDELVEDYYPLLSRLGFRQSFIPSEHVGLYERYGYHYITEITNYGGGTDHLYEKYI